MFNECRHIMSSGLKCRAAALRDKPFCYFHTSLHFSAVPRTSYADLAPRFPPLEDECSLKIAIGEVLSALNSSRIDARRAGVLLYGLQIAAQVTGRPSTIDESDLVRSTCDGENGELLAPEKTTCEPPEDCYSCTKREECDDFDIYADEVEENEKAEEEEEGEQEDEASDE